MGLLEEAIREHLELQRRHGADPSRVARAEQEALQPLVPGKTPEWAQGPLLFDHELVSAGAAPAPRAANGLAARRPSAPSPAGAKIALVERDTEELDMSALFAEASEPQGAPAAPEVAAGEFGPVRARRIVADREAAIAGEGDFQWEDPERPVRQGSFAFE